MYIIVVGCGRVGSDLAGRLSRQGHDVTVIDYVGSSFKHLDPEYRGRTIEAEPLAEDVLKKAGIEQADALAAVTSSDTTNAVVAQIAQGRVQGAATSSPATSTRAGCRCTRPWGSHVVSDHAVGIAADGGTCSRPGGAVMNVLIAGGGRTGPPWRTRWRPRATRSGCSNTAPTCWRTSIASCPRRSSTKATRRDPRTLELAGIGHTDVLVAAMRDDAANLSICFVARERFKVPRTIADDQQPAQRVVVHDARSTSTWR